MTDLEAAFHRIEVLERDLEALKRILFKHNVLAWAEYQDERREVLSAEWNVPPVESA